MQTSLARLLLLVLLLNACADPPADHTRVTPSGTPAPAQTVALTASVTPTQLAVSSPDPTISPTPVRTIEALTHTPTPTRPASHQIANIYGERQAYPLSCESRAAVDWAAYYGFTILEAEFQFNLPFSDNPDLGFVGVTTGVWGQVPPYDYGVHAAPVAELLRAYGVPAAAVKQFDLDSLKNLIAQDHPVLTWVIGNVEGGVPYVYTDSQGNQVTVAAYEHVVIVYGYDDSDDTLIYMNNGKHYRTPSSVFDNSWSVLERMAIYYDESGLP
ncbi:MAG: C39 family peptidase [Anaerolineae bacterium]|nr:C39 family peptidase [Anaerolineae bacterium]